MATTSSFCASKLLYLNLRTKKTNLLYVTLLIILFTAIYLIGLWQHSRGTIPLATTTALSQVGNAVSCTPPNDIIIVNAKNNNNPQHELDFSAHHQAADPPPIAARVRHLPPCDVKYSEYVPCEDTQRSLKFDRDRLIYRERHCPEKNELLKCRVPAPYGYRSPFRWPESRDFAWYANVPHKWLTVEKKGQNWVRFNRDRFSFPGGGTMFPNGADVYINEIGRLVNLNDGSIRTAIDTGCGVASWGAYLLSKNILAMSFAPKDTHEAQVQFALERGVPALIGVIASIRLPYPSRAFDMAHCSRCLIPWGQYDGQYLIEVDRILRPGGYWILSGPPVNWQRHWKGWNRTTEDLQEEQFGIEKTARSLCWKKLVQKGDLAIFQKATNHIHCKSNRKVFKKPQFCKAQDPDMAWYTKLETCLTPLPEVSNIKQMAGGQLAKWPERLTAIPPRIYSGSLGITADNFREDTKLWEKRVAYYKSIDNQLAERGRYRNVLDMNSHLGGFAAALIDDPAWVMNMVPVEAQINTLGVIYERGLIGTYQNWCEAMSTYPRTYDFIHANSVFSLYKGRCDMEDILLEMDRILRPEGTVIIRDDVDIVLDIKRITDGMQWDSRIVDHEQSPHYREKILFAFKACFFISIAFLLILTIIALCYVKDEPLTEEQLRGMESGGNFFTGIFGALAHLEKPMWILLLVTCLNWIGWFPFLLFDTDWMAREVYGGNASGTAEELRVYNNGVHAGSLGLLLNAVVLGIMSLVIEPVGRLLGGVKRLWGIVNFILALGLALTLVVSKAAESHYATTVGPNGEVHILPPPTSVKAGALAIFAGLGIPQAITYSVPFALASIFCKTSSDKSTAGQGLSLGVLNLAIVLPQMFVSAIAGPLDAAFGGGNEPAFVFGAVAAALSGVVALLVLPSPPAGVSTKTVAGGFH